MREFVLERGGRVIQEQLSTEWEILVAAILLNQSRRTPAWDRTLARVLQHFPTPQAMVASSDFLEHLLKPHGFHNVKARRLRRMSEEYLTWDGVNPRKLYGVGEYAADSHRIFLRGHRPLPETVKDGPLGAYLTRYWEKCGTATTLKFTTTQKVETGVRV